MLNTLSELVSPKISPISEYAIIVDPRDNVAVVKAETAAGLLVALPDNRTIEVKNVVAPGHRLRLARFPPANLCGNTISRLAQVSASVKAKL